MIAEIVLSKPMLAEIIVGKGADGGGIPCKDGAPGLSAFEIAVLKGFKGTVQEWLDSLRGMNGKSLSFKWDGTRLGVKKEEDPDYSYTDLKGLKGDDSFVTVFDLKAETAAKYDEARVAFYPIGKDYFGVNYKWFSVRLVDGAKKFLPIGLTYITTDDNGINQFDPITERYIQLKTWEQLRGQKGDSVSILENGHWALNGVDTGVKAEGGKGDPGADGLSAYKVALSNGFDGTEQQWLESLKGRPGINGLGYLAISNSGQNVPAVGAVARINIPYSSAYQHGTRIRAASVTTPATAWFEGVITESDGNSQMVAVDVAEGVGTNVSAWAISVAGIPGKNGIGVNGKSAYEIEKVNGTFSGTEADYANSFKELREHPRSKEVHISKEEREFWNSIATPLIINELPLNVLLNANKRFINVLGFSSLTSNNSGGTDMSQGAEIHYQLIAEVNFRLVSVRRADKVANYNILLSGSTYAGAGVQSSIISKNFDEIGLLFSTTASQQIRPDEKYLPRSEYNVLSAYIDKNAMALEPNSYFEIVIRRVYRESSLRDGGKKSFDDSFIEYDYNGRKYGYEAMSTNLDIAFSNVVDPLGGKINDMRVANPIFNALAAADKDTLIDIIKWLIDKKQDVTLSKDKVRIGSNENIAEEVDLISPFDPNIPYLGQFKVGPFSVEQNAGTNGTLQYIKVYKSQAISLGTNGITLLEHTQMSKELKILDIQLDILGLGGTLGGVQPTVKLCSDAAATTVISNIPWLYWAGAMPKSFDCPISIAKVNLSNGLYLSVSGGNAPQFNICRLVITGVLVQ